MRIYRNGLGLNLIDMIAIFLLTALIGFQVESAYASEYDAPFGLVWGAKNKELEKLGVTLKLDQRLSSVNIFNAETLPLTPSGTIYIKLSIDDKFGMQRVNWIGGKTENDIFGSEGKKKFSELENIITEKYGNPLSDYKYVGKKLYREHDEFYQCLAYKGCGSWITFWRINSGGSISLELSGLGRGSGVMKLIYEGPGWEAVVNSVKEERAKKSKKAF